ncbi:nuclear transport factor 2 family protein [Salinimicrobium sp. GXAS 041]|uniref:nuclear transport factor 2 family protein n=1 Tax=Salinimicrobium sp. GXAS 041 TaxID=3400806 RepID=UPI003C70CE5E
MNKFFPALIVFMLFSCDGKTSQTETAPAVQISSEERQENINEVLDEWHKAAAQADFEAYFSKMAENAIFIGTDPTENWMKPDFKNWAKPYFDRGKAWDFTSLERNIFFSENQRTAWFDELLETQMGLCRGSGVLTLENGEWKIRQYVLSIAVPNEEVSNLTELKNDFDQQLILKLKTR